ncbi:LysR family transcriptional regulator [Siculibacillus lacustris]|uniref:LysR family transcriptional regulator n=1 Tax=Siculibacillus lacustris TaxID=1549641 RepID=A0A4Q9VND7_9HYPH|nr:LysR family transcriptional regulator [Siculibacillus lacustris]TBW37186.1 LysR family transcriptional regulator [Siculibacillus lacustris]
MRGDASILSTAFRYFLAVAEVGSIRAAARDLNIVSSAVNRQILLLEEQLGIRLFDRVGRGLRLSEAGTLLARRVRDTLVRYEDVIAELDTLRGLRRGRVRIATVESMAVERVPDLLAAFWGRYGGIEVALVRTTAEEVNRLVEDGRADLGFTFSTGSLDSLRVIHREIHALGVVLAADHPLADRPSLTLADLAEELLVVPARGLSLRAALEPALARLKRPPLLRAECDSLRLMSALVARTRSVGFLTAVGIESERRRGEIAWVPLGDPDVLPDRLAVVVRAGIVPSLALAALIDFIEEAWGDRNVADSGA